MKSLSQMGKEAVTFSAIMVDRTPIKTQEVLNKELTVILVDFAPKLDETTRRPLYNDQGVIETYPVVVFSEYPNNFYGAGIMFDKAAKTWLAAYGTLEELNAQLVKEGGVKVRFFDIPGKRYHGVEFL